MSRWLTALIVPNGTLIAACVLAGLGGVLILVGYTVGLWAAFREDSLYGFFYFVFPLYTAYYILRGVPLSAGTHHLHFFFLPQSVLLGGAISALALLSALLILIRTMHQQRRGRV